MSRRFCTALLGLGFALGATSCESWNWNQKPPGDDVVMPLQTGSTIQRRMAVPDPSSKPPKKPRKNAKEQKEQTKKKKESRNATPTPAPSRPKRESEPEPEVTPSAPDRLR